MTLSDFISFAILLLVYPTVSGVFHEFGHKIAFACFGIKTRIAWGFTTSTCFVSDHKDYKWLLRLGFFPKLLISAGGVLAETLSGIAICLFVPGMTWLHYLAIAFVVGMSWIVNVFSKEKENDGYYIRQHFIQYMRTGR